MQEILLATGLVRVKASRAIAYTNDCSGFLPLASLPILKLLGGSQFRKFCVVAMLILIITVGITCFCQDERVRKDDRKDKEQR
jgi:hypothetical protein